MKCFFSPEVCNDVFMVRNIASVLYVSTVKLHVSYWYYVCTCVYILKHIVDLSVLLYFTIIHFNIFLYNLVHSVLSVNHISMNKNI